MPPGSKLHTSHRAKTWRRSSNGRAGQLWDAALGEGGGGSERSRKPNGRHRLDLSSHWPTCGSTRQKLTTGATNWGFTSKVHTPWASRQDMLILFYFIYLQTCDSKPLCLVTQSQTTNSLLFCSSTSLTAMRRTKTGITQSLNMWEKIATSRPGGWTFWYAYVQDHLQPIPPHTTAPKLN